MKECNVYVKGVVYDNKGKGLALSAWGVSGEKVRFVEHEYQSAYGAEFIAVQEAFKELGGKGVALHFYSNQKALVDKMKADENMKSLLQCDFTWCRVADSPKPLRVLRDIAMSEVARRGAIR